MFKKGQKLVCVKNGKWRGNVSGIISDLGPKYGEQVTFVKEAGVSSIVIVEYKSLTQTGGYAARWFIPLEEWDKLMKEADEAIKELVKVELVS